MTKVNQKLLSANGGMKKACSQKDKELVELKAQNENMQQQHAMAKTQHWAQVQELQVINEKSEQAKEQLKAEI